MTSQPSSDEEINVESRRQPQNQEDGSELQLSPQLQQIPRAIPSHSPPESHVPPTRSPVMVSFPNPRDTAAATLGLPERLDLDVPFPVYNPVDRRTSGYSILRSHNGDYLNGRRRANDFRRSTTQPTLVPAEDWMYPPLHERLEKTLENAAEARNKSRLTARSAKWSIIIVAGAQVLLGALITGLSALRLDSQSASSTTTALGILSTLSGSYLAHIRATAEPERSIVRMHKLDAFVRDLDAFILDHGYDTTNKYNHEIEKYRRELEHILSESSPLDPSRRPPSNLLVEDKAKLGGAPKEIPV